MALFGGKDKPKKGGLLGDMIMSPDQNRDWLFYKWRPEGNDAGSTNRENSIRLGSPLTVRPGEVAVFLYPAQRQKLGGQTGTGQTLGGGSLDFIEGYFQAEITTANLPILAGLQSLFFDGGSRFPAMIYFINTAAVNQTNFAVPYFNMFDPRLPDHPAPVAVRGNITFKIADVRAFVAMHSLADLDMQKFAAKIKSAVVDYVQSAMMDIMKHNQMAGYPLIQINTYRRNVRAIIEDDLKRSLLGTYGVTLTELNLTAIELDEESEGYRRLAKLTKDIQETKIETQAELSRRGMEDQYEMNKANLERTSQINLDHMEDSMAKSREAAFAAQNMQTQMGGLALHQLDAQRDIGVASANAMGQMGQGAGVSIPGGGGFNPGAMMAGMAMGGAVGQGMAGMMGNVFNQMGQGMQSMPQVPGQTPPPMPGGGAPPPQSAAPAMQFSVSVNGQNYGPYDMNAMAQMVQAGQLNAQSQVWRQGMPGWQAAGTVPELAQLFAGASAPPPPPPPAV
jgi:membrane protease subunit (stomatin/prohibitin family)